MKGDPLGRMSLSEQNIIQRDLIIFEIAKKFNIPILMLLSGGYQLKNAEVIAQSINQIINTYP